MALDGGRAVADSLMTPLVLTRGCKAHRAVRKTLMAIGLNVSSTVWFRTGWFLLQ